MIIGFTGKKQSGKTEAARFLEEYKLINFKDALIEEIVENFPDLLRELSISYKLPIQALFLLKPPLMRRLMQNYGTNVRRKDKEDYWIKRWLYRVYPRDDNIVVDDVRFINEAKIIKQLGGTVIRLVRQTTEKDTHISELEMDEIKEDYTINNNKDLVFLKEEVKKCLENITKLGD